MTTLTFDTLIAYIDKVLSTVDKDSEYEKELTTIKDELNKNFTGKQLEYRYRRVKAIENEIKSIKKSEENETPENKSWFRKIVDYFKLTSTWMIVVLAIGILLVILILIITIVVGLIIIFKSKKTNHKSVSSDNK